MINPFSFLCFLTLHKAKLSQQLIRCLLAHKVPQSYFKVLFEQQMEIVKDALKSPQYESFYVIMITHKL
jgi:hypothetical protein